MFCTTPQQKTVADSERNRTNICSEDDNLFVDEKSVMAEVIDRQSGIVSRDGVTWFLLVLTTVTDVFCSARASAFHQSPGTYFVVSSPN